ncbi:hypothetical protein AB0F72_36835 [Actinoplanes sp. NPDC023936]|uniref:DedA family protein n=1 Tax=Actinoplanes sp. NPDC023936 TaxID=3154910 RepID=UPI0033C6993B
MIEDLLGGLPPIVVYLVAGALVTLETALLAGLVLPAATALIAMGLLANAGVVDVVPALLVAVASAVLGGNIAYRRGAFPGMGRHAERTERLFARFGGRAVFFGQWVVGARTLMPRLAARNGVPPIGSLRGTRRRQASGLSGWWAQATRPAQATTFSRRAQGARQARLPR